MAHHKGDESLDGTMNSSGSQPEPEQDRRQSTKHQSGLESAGAPAADAELSSDQHDNGSTTSMNASTELGRLRDHSSILKSTDPPLPSEAPPLPEQAPPQDDGWDYGWSEEHQRWYFYNRYTKLTQWDNPRQADAKDQGAVTQSSKAAAPPPPPPPGTQPAATSSTTGATGKREAPGDSDEPHPPDAKRIAGGYNPAIHGSYDENADYAIQARLDAEAEEAALNPHLPPPGAPNMPPNPDQYAAEAHFNRYTGKFQNASVNPDRFNDENKSRRQMNAYFDVDAAANSHDGRSLKAERRERQLTKEEVREFRIKRRAKKEEKRRAWLRD